MTTANSIILLSVLTVIAASSILLVEPNEQHRFFRDESVTKQMSKKSNVEKPPAPMSPTRVQMEVRIDEEE